MFENLTSTGAITVTASQPTTCRTMQMKGTVDRIDALTQAHHDRVAGHREQFSAEVVLMGIDSDTIGNVFLGDLVLVSFEVEEDFDQTPRTGAGSRLW